MPRKRECAANPGKVDRAPAETGFHILPRNAEEAWQDAVGLAIGVPFGLMFLWAGVAF